MTSILFLLRISNKLKKLLLVIFFYSFFGFLGSAQTIDSLPLNRNRLKSSIALTGAVYIGTLFSLNELWYANHDRSNFHFFNDNSQWKQMDKIGHVYSSYMGGTIGYQALNYSGLNNKKSTLYGGGLGFLFLSTVEVFDGYSTEWGFSWGDVISNGIGTSLFMGQQLLFEKQIIQPKYSFSSSEYRTLRPEILGENSSEAYLKDYNGQTYWYSINLNSINNKVKPKWLNMAIGYGANGMVNAKGSFMDNGLLIDPYRQYYVSLDIDFTKIETESKLLKSIFKAANFIKVPSPTLEFNQNRKTNFYWLFF